MAEAHPSVGDVRGVGLFRGLELTRHPEKRVPFGQREDKLSKGQTVVDEVTAAAYDRGTYVANMINTVIVAPPLVITETEIDEAVAALLHPSKVRLRIRTANTEAADALVEQLAAASRERPDRGTGLSPERAESMVAELRSERDSWKA
jgi:hypothetical protein